MKLGWLYCKGLFLGIPPFKEGRRGGGGEGGGCLLTELVAGPLAVLIADLRKLYARLCPYHARSKDLRRARNVHARNISYEHYIFEFRLIIISIFSSIRFIRTFFSSEIQKHCPLKYV